MAKPNPFLALTLKSLESAQVPIIDIRPVTEFVTGHLPLATSLPLEDLESSWHELPPKGSRLNLLANSNQLNCLAEIFERQDYSIENITLADEVPKDRLEQNNISQRLWKANPLLEQNIELINNLCSNSQPKVFDIGCGSGRDSLFLSLHGYQAIAIDNNDYALERLKKFKKRWHANIETFNLDLQCQMAELAEMINQNQPHLVVQARYLHRPLLDVYKDMLAKGSIVAIHTFTQEAAKFGKPKNPAYLLQNDELFDKFKDWNILIDAEYLLEDGRPLSMFLAQKN